MQDTGSIDIKGIIGKVKKNWYLFVISLTLCVGGAVFLNWYTEPVYQVKTIILMKNNKEGSQSSSKDFLQSFSMFSVSDDFQNEILLLQSSSLIYRALKKTNLDVTYYQKVGLQKRELYKDSPFRIKMVTSHIQPISINFQIIPLKGNQFKIVAENDEESIELYDYEKNMFVSSVNRINLDRTYNYGDTVKGEHFEFMVLADVNKLIHFEPNTKFYFWFNDLNILAYYLQSVMKVSQVNPDVTAAEIKIKTNHPEKGIDFINAITEAYLEQNLDRKNFTAKNTIQYIESQLTNIEDSLKYAEQNLQNFRSNHQVMDISSKANRMYDLVRDLENQKAEASARAKYYEYIQDYLNKNRELAELMVPSAMGVNNEVLSKITQDLLNLSGEKNSLLKNKQDKSPYFNSLTIKIDNLKNALAENIKYSINSNTLSINGIEDRLRKLYGELNQLPGTERQLFGIERKFKLNDNIYTFLLEKRAEAQIAKASNLPDNEIVESARLSPAGQVSPNTKMNLIFALIIGLLIPFGFFWIKETMDETVTDEKALKSISKLSIIGHVNHNTKKNRMSVLIDSPKSQISESLRAVRTNLDYFLQGKRKQVILLTSTIGGEGKSFNALNIAIGLALFERKTILLEFDLRKPKLNEYLGVENILGISSYLINKANIDDVIVSTDIKYLDFIPAGPVPPNPVELIGSEKTEQFINQLKQRYDYVIIDTPPIGLVTEAFLLMKYSDLKIFVVRQNLTPRKQLTSVLSEIEEKHISNMCLLLNDVSSRNGLDKYGYYSKKP